MYCFVAGPSEKYTQFKTNYEENLKDKVAQKCDCTPTVGITSVTFNNNNAKLFRKLLDGHDITVVTTVENASESDTREAMEECSEENGCVLGGGKVMGVPTVEESAKENAGYMSCVPIFLIRGLGIMVVMFGSIV